MARRTAAILGYSAYLLIAGSGALLGDEPTDRPPFGFLPASRAAEARAEAQALRVPTPEMARRWLHALTEEPHVAGTEADRKVAVSIRDRLRGWGWEADLAEYKVLLNYPVPESVHLEIVRPTPKKLAVYEEPHPSDKDSASRSAFPAFHGYGVSGDVTGQVVYANYGRPEDFKELEKLGIEVRDKIVLVRYGELFRGLKVRNAQKRGAKGTLIYSDPADDGYAKGDIYPTGSFRPPSAIQRGSAQFLSLGPGDPSTPNGPSTEDAERLPFNKFDGFPLESKYSEVYPIYFFYNNKENYQSRHGFNSDEQIGPGNRDVPPERLDSSAWEKATGLKREDYHPAIPSLPISYESAKPILEALGGPNVPAAWQGALPLPYHTGPGPSEVHFGIRMDYDVRPIWNVIAKLRGSVEPDRWVLLSNHHDAWVYGAADPGSGTAATLETCRALGAAVRAGWKPRRTIVFCGWDAEEYGLVGSTEWAEDHGKDLDTRAVLMLNVDVAVSGPNVEFGGVPSLRDLVLDAAETVTDIRTGRTLRDIWTGRRRTAWANSDPVDLDESVWVGSPEGKKRPWPAQRFSPALTPLGSGSDYTAFLDHLGIPCLDIGFSGRYGVYHSIYDNFYWMEKFGDPEFLTHATAARLYTAIVMRAAAADVVPFRFVPYGEALQAYVDDLRRMVVRKQRAAEANPRALIMAAGFPGLIQAVRRFQDQAAELDRATAALMRVEDVKEERLGRINEALQRIERSFLMPSGLPGRPWFKHAIYAPGLTTGYASWPLPGVRQAIQDDDVVLLGRQLPALLARLDAATAALREARRLVREAIPDPKE